MNLGGHAIFQEKIKRIFQEYHAKTAITYMRNDNTRSELSFETIYKIILDFQHIFEQYGLRAGDRIVILTPHSPYGIIAGLAAAYWQYTSVLIDASLPEEEIRRLVDGTDVRVVLTTEKIPVRITGAYDIFPYMRKYPKWMDITRGKRYKLQIEFMKPILPNNETKESLTEKLYQAIEFGKEVAIDGVGISETTTLSNNTGMDWNLLRIVQNYCPDAEITENSRLREDLGIDSLNMFEMVCMLEERYHISIAEDMGKIVTYRDLEDRIKNEGGNT